MYYTLENLSSHLFSIVIINLIIVFTSNLIN